MATRRPGTRTRLTLFVGLLAVVIGIVVAATAPPSASFGWFAYAPLSDEAFVADSTNWHFWSGVLVAVAGAVVAAFAAGRLSVRRPR